MNPSPTPFVNLDFRTIDLRVVLAAITAVIGLITIFYFQWWRNRKRLSYDMLSDVLLVSADEEVRDKVEIRFEGNPVKNVRLMVIKLVNDGYLPIKKDEFEQPLKFLFPKRSCRRSELCTRCSARSSKSRTRNQCVYAYASPSWEFGSRLGQSQKRSH